MSRIVVLVAAAAAAVAVIAAPASAHTLGLPQYSVSGIETGVPQGGVSPFAGVASSSRGPAVWSANVPHDPLDGCIDAGSGACSTIRAGGSFSLSGLFLRVQGTFDDGGTIALVSGDPLNCGSRTSVYEIDGDVTLTRGGSGTERFHATLTHYQAELLGSCIPYFATVTGTFG